MRVRELACTAMVLGAAAIPSRVLSQATKDQARLIFTVSGGVVAGRDLWSVDAQPVQSIAPALLLDLPLIDVSTEDEAQRRATEEARLRMDEARRLWKAVGRPNLMIKVPGTEAGSIRPRTSPIPSPRSTTSSPSSRNVRLPAPVFRSLRSMRVG